MMASIYFLETDRLHHLAAGLSVDKSIIALATT